MTVDDLVKKYGSAGRAADILNIPRGTIHAWKARGGIPFSAQFRIQLKTRGLLKADTAALLKS